MDIIDRYGVKEVADVTIYELDEFENIGKPVLFLDTLKVSEIEFENEESKHYGGMGNNLITNWSYTKEATVKIEDALFSMKSLAMLCGGKVSSDNKKIVKTERFRATGETVPTKEGNENIWNSISGWNNKFISIDGKEYNKLYPRFYDSEENEISKFVVGKLYYCTYYLNSEVFSIDITSNSFSGYYYLIGETFIRSEITGNDELFYFVVPKAKLTSDLTLNLSAEEVAVFNFNFSAVKSRRHNLIELFKLKDED